MLGSSALTLLPTDTCRDLAPLFGVTNRTVQSKVAGGRISSRKLMGGPRSLAVDVEAYLRNALDVSHL